MINLSKDKKIRQFVQQQLEKNFYSKTDNQMLLKQINQFIRTSDFGGIVGEYGTGKKQIVDEIIGPAVEEFYGLSCKTKYDINIADPRLNEILSEASGKVLIITEFDPLFEYNDNLSLTWRMIRERLASHNIIQLPNLQQQYIDYPEIITKIVKQECGIPFDRILIGICGYIELMISGLPSNYFGLLKLIRKEIIEDGEVYKEKAPQVKNIGFYLHFNSYFDTMINRKEIWKSFWGSSYSVPLLEIQEFNRQYTKNGQDKINVASTGPWRKHPDELILVKLKKYCKALIFKFNNGSIDDAVTIPIDEKISRLSNPTSEKYKLNGFIYHFFANKPISRTDSSNRIKEDGNSTSILQFDTIEIKVPGLNNPGIKCQFRLNGNHGPTQFIEIIPSYATFLLYLAQERKVGGEDWLIEPENHLGIIIEIVNKFELSPIYFEECLLKKRPDDPDTWIWDYRQSDRRSIVSNLNKKLRDIANLRSLDYFIMSRPANNNRAGNYSIIKHITKVKITEL